MKTQGRKIQVGFRSLHRSLAIGAGVVLVSHAPVSAQGFANEIAVIGANTLIGSASAAIVALAEGRPVLPALAIGGAGGACIYAGKLLSSAYKVPGSGIAGRVVAATGTSMVMNAAAGRGPFEVLALPVGPLTFYRRPPGDSLRAPVRFSLVRGVYLGMLIGRESSRMDWNESLRGGAPVFHTPGRVLSAPPGHVVHGTSFAGSIVLSDLEAMTPRPHRGNLVAHERVHVLQDDFVAMSWTGSLEGWLLGLLPGGRHIRRWVDPGFVHLATVALAVLTVPYERRIWEMEAHHFGGGR